MILVCGEALIDLFVETGRPDAARRGLPALAVAGGSSLNLAIGIARLGARSGYLGGLSDDPFGRLLAARLSAEGVDLAFAKASTRPTALALVATGADGQPAYTFHAEGCAHADLLPTDVPGRLPDEVRAIAIGSFAFFMEPAASSCAALAAREAGRRIVSLDPNLRPSLIGDLAHWRERFDRLVHHADIVKLSDEDLRAAFGAGADEAACATRWLEAGVALVVVTAGPRGAAAYHASGRVAVPARAVDVIDTVGAGDTFHAALLARLAREDRLSRAALDALDADGLGALLTEAATVASITCSRRGADLPALADVVEATGGGDR